MSQSRISRRGFLTALSTLLTASAAKAEDKKYDGGLAFIPEKSEPPRKTGIAPAGAKSLRNFYTSCTACQLCIAACPNDVLRPSANLTTFMQPEVFYNNGYCRPECVICSQVCPAGAIEKISAADKSSIQTGHAVWLAENCIPLVNGDNCDNCARHCPTQAITMMLSEKDNEASPKIPVIDVERCIGCGACEHLCPARPVSAIYVEGHEVLKHI